MTTPKAPESQMDSRRKALRIGGAVIGAGLLASIAQRGAAVGTDHPTVISNELSKAKKGVFNRVIIGDEADGDTYTEDLVNKGTTRLVGALNIRNFRGVFDLKAYGAVGDGTTDDTTAMLACFAAAVAAGGTVWVPAGEFKHTSTMPITASASVDGLGRGLSRFLSVGCDAITVSAGVNFVSVANVSLATSVRHTTTPNALAGIRISGTTASQNFRHVYRDLFIDGFETGIVANAVWQTTFDTVNIIQGKHGITNTGESQNVVVANCVFTGNGLGYGVKVGGGSDNTEGWIIQATTIYNYARGVYGYGSSHCAVVSCIIDPFTEFGVLLQSGTTECTGWTVDANLISATGATADSGIYCANAVAVAAQQNHGHAITNNNIRVYVGSTLTRGILIDGTQDNYHTITGNRCEAGTFDCRIATGTGHVVTGNHWLGPGYSGAVAVHYSDNHGTLITTAAASISSRTTGAQSVYGTIGISGTTRIKDDGSYVNRAAATASRPASPTTGQCFFDTTLNKPIWYGNAGWVDSAGASV